MLCLMSININTNPIEDTLNWFSTCFPERNIKTQVTQLSVMFEEVAEALRALGLPSQELEQTTQHIREGLYTDFLEHQLSQKEIKVELLDALADIYVTSVGSAYNLEMDFVGAVNEVNKSNNSKLDEEGKPIYNEFGKVIKGPNYFPPDLTSFV